MSELHLRFAVAVLLRVCSYRRFVTTRLKKNSNLLAYQEIALHRMHNTMLRRSSTTVQHAKRWTKYASAVGVVGSIVAAGVIMDWLRSREVEITADTAEDLSMIKLHGFPYYWTIHSTWQPFYIETARLYWYDHIRSVVVTTVSDCDEFSPATRDEILFDESLILTQYIDDETKNRFQQSHALTDPQLELYMTWLSLATNRNRDLIRTLKLFPDTRLPNTLALRHFDANHILLRALSALKEPRYRDKIVDIRVCYRKGLYTYLQHVFKRNE